jgi:hypothetical protein
MQLKIIIMNKNEAGSFYPKAGMDGTLSPRTSIYNARNKQREGEEKNSCTKVEPR